MQVWVMGLMHNMLCGLETARTAGSCAVLIPHRPWQGSSTAASACTMHMTCGCCSS